MLKNALELYDSDVALVPPGGGEGQGDLVVGWGFHPDEAYQARAAAYLADNPIPGLDLLECHPLAGMEHVRYLGRAQLSEFFPGDIFSADPEESAAGWVAAELGVADPWLFPVLHDTVPGTSSFAAVGPKTTEAALGLACYLDLQQLFISRFPFHRCVPRTINVEMDRTETDGLGNPSFLRERFKEVVKLGELGLQAYFNEYGGKLSYYSELVEISRARIDDPKLLNHLERIPAPGRFESPGLSDDTMYELIKQLRGKDIADVVMSKTLKVVASSWGTKGQTSPGVPTEFFGVLLIESKPPQLDDEGWMAFQDPLA